MANILINNFCNLKCSYCFADDVIKQKNFAITSDELARILKYFEYKSCCVSLIGGEPTIHPDFIGIYHQYMDHINKYDGLSKLFTNATNLEPYLDDIDKKTNILINVNRDNEDAYTKLISCLEKISSIDRWANTAIGCNVSPDRNNYSFFWDLVKEYKIKAVRYAVVTPGGILCHYLSDKDSYYKMMKPIFLDFCREAIENKCQIMPDCAQIPICYFNDDEIKVVKQAAPTYASKKCSFVCDIEPDGTSSWCFGSGIKANLFDFDSIDDMARHMRDTVVIDKISHNFMQKCDECFKKNRICSGGCMSFAK